jgi:hypothetical protein
MGSAVEEIPMAPDQWYAYWSEDGDDPILVRLIELDYTEEPDWDNPETGYDETLQQSTHYWWAEDLAGERKLIVSHWGLSVAPLNEMEVLAWATDPKH